MSSTEPDNTHTDSDHGTDTTALLFFGPPTADEIRDQLDAQLSAKEKEHLVFVADSAKIEQDYQAALAINADPSTLRHHEELKEAHRGLHEQFLSEWAELLRRSIDMNREAKARVVEEKEAIKKELMAAKKELMARKEAAKKREEERARVKEEKARAKEERKKARREEIAMIEAQTARSLEVIKETKKLHAVLRRRIAVERVEVEAQKIEREVLKARKAKLEAENAEIKAETRMYKNELLEIYLYRWIEDLD
ncbi:uncharacterized protein J4E88_007371 [Alternaria novae-zelandiae]|uniref:uncharacterized protein n=1 Tax=Alternaria novae-zelandiae TaxID=430562 RepID=UPI0020C4CD1D|nr:uncharacterized protein J4E88_007371 [Alternaria novae-zelandiae]KAI4676453.1 hypothetical protein J4E88_007371 [Alternaria novae-zelandiae]